MSNKTAILRVDQTLLCRKLEEYKVVESRFLRLKRYTLASLPDDSALADSHP